MFNKDFYPTPRPVIDQLLSGLDLFDKKVLDPEAGKGDILDVAKELGAITYSCELHKDLANLVKNKSTFIKHDFLSTTSDELSHIDFIVMNPPFSADEKHIIHAWEVAPEGCEIRALCNLKTITETNHYSNRKQLSAIVKDYGNFIDLGNCFSTAERSTDVEVAMITLFKPKTGPDAEFEGFFMEEDVESQGYGMMRYDKIRDLVQRYVTAIKLFDQQLEIGVQMQNTISGYFRTEKKYEFKCTESEKIVTRVEFKKQLQKSAWAWVFEELKMRKFITKGVRDDINKFVENQHTVPFTMKNIHKMIEILVKTHS